MDRKKLEEKLKGLQIPPPDEKKKETVIQSVMAEFDEAHKKTAKEGKGIEERARLTGKKERFAFLKGGPIMRRPVYATISIVFLAVVLGYSFMIYNKEDMFTSTREVPEAAGFLADVKQMSEPQEKRPTPSPVKHAKKNESGRQAVKPIAAPIIISEKKATLRADGPVASNERAVDSITIRGAVKEAEEGRAIDTLVNVPGKSNNGTKDDSFKWTFKEDGNVVADAIGSTRLNLGEDLANDHPVSITYDGKIKTLKPTAAPIMTATKREAVSERVEVDYRAPKMKVKPAPVMKMNKMAPSRSGGSGGAPIVTREKVARPRSDSFYSSNSSLWNKGSSGPIVRDERVTASSSGSRTGVVKKAMPVDLRPGGIAGSRHNLGAWGVHLTEGAIGTLGGSSEVCIWCHSPHDLSSVESSWDSGPKPTALECRGCHKDTDVTSTPVHSSETSKIKKETGRDKFERVKDRNIKIVTDEPVSTFSIDVDTASYAFVRRALMNGNLPQKDAVRIEELINYFDYDYKAAKSAKKPFRPTVAVYPTPWNADTKLMHIGIKGYEIERSERPSANLVFLIDVSGSMRSADKLPLLKNSLKMLVNELEEDDSVAIVVYAGAAGAVLEPTQVADKHKILSAIDRLQSGGSTAGGVGLKLAYSLAESNFEKGAVNRVILATDGDFNVGITDKNELKGFIERKRDTGIYLSVLGFGQGNYNDELMQKLAQNGNGNAAYIDTLSEARKVLVEEAGSTLFTIARDVKIQVEFNPERVSDYRLIGYETRALKREDFNNDKVDAGDVGSGHTVTAIYEITPVENATRLIDPLRYGSEKPDDYMGKKGERGPIGIGGHEYGFLKVRYKLPTESKSTLITMPIDHNVEYSETAEAPADVRFAAGVAAFGQLLKGGKYTGSFSYDDLTKLAESSRGRDRKGYRSEFLRLIGLAKSADEMGQR